MIDNYFAQKETRLREDTQFNYFFEFDTSKNDIQKQIALFIEKLKVTNVE